MEDGTIELEFAGETYPFRLGMGALRELQQKCTEVCPLTDVVTAKGFPPVILARLQNNEWLVQDIVLTLKLGLIGGGAKTSVANNLIEQYVEPRLIEHVITATFVLYKALNIDFSLPKIEENKEEQEPKKEQAATMPPV